MEPSLLSPSPRPAGIRELKHKIIHKKRIPPLSFEHVSDGGNHFKGKKTVFSIVSLKFNYCYNCYLGVLFCCFFFLLGASKLKVQFVYIHSVKQSEF